MNIKLIFMSIVVLGLIVNITSFSGLAFADQSEKSEAKAQKEAEKAERESEREAEKAERESEREAEKAEREEIKKFSDDAVITSSSSSSADKVTICHIPPGNPDNAHTITVGTSALRAHESHGDFIGGSCDNDDFNPDEYESKKEERLSESSDKESKALERAERLIEKLEKQISQLEQRLQKLLDKYESGEYFGNISNMDSITNSYEISFEGSASSIYDESITTEMTGTLYLENQVTTSDTSKFKITSGEVIIGSNIYDIVFGKARSSSGESSDGNPLTVLLQTVDSEENQNTIKFVLGFEPPFDGEITSPKSFEILENSIVSGQWKLSGAGQISLEN